MDRRVRRLADLEHLGGWDEAVALNEDWDLNERYRNAGFVVWFDPEMDAQYLPRRSFTPLARQYFRLVGSRARGGCGAGGPRRANCPFAAAARRRRCRGDGRRGGRSTSVGRGSHCRCVCHRCGWHAEPAAIPVRIGALAATATSSTSWWIGVVVGVVGELRGGTPCARLSSRPW